MIKIQEVSKKEIWENFLLKSSVAVFYQSWNMGEVFLADRTVSKVFRFGIFDEGNLVGVALTLLKKSKRGSFLHIPMGPVLAHKKYFKNLVEFLKDFAKRDNLSFIKINPFWENSPENNQIFKDFGFKESAIHVSAEKTLVLGLGKSEDELLAEMRKTTRNLVKRAAKDGVEIRKGVSDELFEDFWKLNLETVQRQKYEPFSKEYSKKEVEIFGKDNQAEIIVGYHEGEPISSGVFAYYGDYAVYHQAASTHSKVPATYLVMWEAIKSAKNRGMKYFNFWGIVGEGEKNHPWFGLSNFKRGFGGKEVDLVHCKDLPIKKFGFLVSYFVDWARRKRRKY